MDFVQQKSKLSYTNTDFTRKKRTKVNSGDYTIKLAVNRQRNLPNGA